MFLSEVIERVFTALCVLLQFQFGDGTMKWYTFLLYFGLSEVRVIVVVCVRFCSVIR